MLRFLTAGESHGPCLIGILEGMPAGLWLNQDEINHQLARRQAGFGRGGRMKIEHDRVEILSGVGWNGPGRGITTGGPIALRIENHDWANWQDREPPPFTVPRPGHADFAGGVKYGLTHDLRLILERASARETAMRVAMATIVRQLLAEFGIQVGSYVLSIGQVEATIPDLPYPELFARAEESDVRCPDPVAAEAMREHIRETSRRRDTLGGVFEVVALGVPVGLGSHVHWDRKLDGRLAQALMSIPAIKGVEIGPAFENARKYGTEVHDEFVLRQTAEASADFGSLITRPTNQAGGLEGGITNGQPIVLRAAMKPISSTLTPLRSVNLATGEPTTTVYERSDICAVPAASIIGEAMMAWVLGEALVEKLGGDSLKEMTKSQ